MKHDSWKMVRTGLRRRMALPLVCYLLAVAVWTALSIFHFGSDALAKAQGRLSYEALGAECFQWVDLEPLGGGYVTTSGDPQIILEDVSGRVVRTLRYQVEWLDNEPREMCLYYTTRPGEPYSQDRRVFPRTLADGSYLYVLPRTSLCALRLDPCSPDANKPVSFVLAPHVIELNASLPGFWQILCPSWYELFCLVLYPALAASAANLLAALFRRYAHR